MNPKIIDEKPISLYDLKAELKKLKKSDEEQNIRTKKTEEYLQNFTILKSAQAKELSKKLTELNIPRLKDQHIAKIVDVLPESAEELKVLLQGYTISITKDNMNKIVQQVKEYITS